jgi:glycine cleavage system pyridoxal-binding protein P
LVTTNSCSAAIQRNILKTRLVHLTPYQAEIAQGRLKHFEFQTMVIELTGMEVNHTRRITAAAERCFMFDVRSEIKEKQCK